MIVGIAYAEQSKEGEGLGQSHGLVYEDSFKMVMDDVLNMLQTV